MSSAQLSSVSSYIFQISVLEYVTQDDADYALRKLDNRELRGIAVRVEPDVSIELTTFQLFTDVKLSSAEGAGEIPAAIAIVVLVAAVAKIVTRSADLARPDGKHTDMPCRTPASLLDV